MEGIGYTYDDVLIIPQYSEINSRKDVDLSVDLGHGIKLKLPVIASPMDTVCGSNMAINMARAGGLGIIHRYCSIEEQVEMVIEVKRAQNYIIEKPYCISGTENVSRAREIMKEKKVGSLIVSLDGKLNGIVSHRDIRHCTGMELIDNVCTRNGTVYMPEVDVSLENARELMQKHRIKTIPITKSKEELEIRGLVTEKDIMNQVRFPNMVLDGKGRLLVGASVGIKGDYLERSKELIEAGIDVLLIDVAFGNNKRVIECIAELRKLYPKVLLISGNVCTEDGMKRMMEAGCDLVRVGIGPGSCCMTRVVAGVGFPQLSAIGSCSRVGAGIADGGIKNSGDCAKALGAGARVVMLGGMLAGCEQSPGRLIRKNGKKYKVVRGMAGTMANLTRKEKMGESVDDIYDYVAEGVDAMVGYKGDVMDVLRQLEGGIRSGMSYVGAKNLEEFRKRVHFIQITGAGSRENGAHDVVVD